MQPLRRRDVQQTRLRGLVGEDDGVDEQCAGESGQGLRVSLSPRRITYALGLVILGLTSAHIILMTLYSSYRATDESGWNILRDLSTLFDLDAEGNPPTWYSSFGLLVCSGLLGLIAFDKAQKRDRYFRHWALLAMVFLYLSIDEGARLHDRGIIPLRSVLMQSGIFYFSWLYSWVVVAILVLLLFGSWYLRFFLHLPKRTQLLFLLAAAVYIGGAIGVEMIAGYYTQLRGGFERTDMGFIFLAAIEESAEMIGALIFLHALMSYIRSHVGEVRLRFDDGRVA
jgi:hypothetical protein